mgnify:FL=1
MDGLSQKKGVSDLYFFGYGHDYKQALNDFYRLCGKTPMLPRYALGTGGADIINTQKKAIWS